MSKLGWFNRERSLQEQLLGLSEALAEAKGKRILDLGCAEGLIAQQFVNAGAIRVHACDNNEQYVAAADLVADAQPLGAMTVEWADLNHGLPDWLLPEYDQVLALAVLHKLKDPGQSIHMAASAVARGGLLVIRLPIRSTGEIHYKHDRARVADTRSILPGLGFTLEHDNPGPRGERVHYWRRAA